jgi:2-amino-4-hydroxy-6-hydroxymethyldihydropteridine diphosphokinase/dihydropteroate synthase
MVVLGLGSNFGDRIEYLRAALFALKSQSNSSEITVLTVSPLYESAALLPPDAPASWDLPFLNFNILCQTTLDPPALLHHIKGIEGKIGRKNRGRWAPREIDIDILAMGDLCFKSEQLQVPHPGLLARPFALLPLADLFPLWRFPVAGPDLGKTATELITAWTRIPAERVPFHTRRSTSCLTELVGILNITPDSFSDGGRFADPADAIQQAHFLVSQGARVLDIGAESTRPGAILLSPHDEWNRLDPVLRQLTTLKSEWPHHVTLSVDTRHAEVAKQAIALGVDWINDVSGFEDPAMVQVLAESSADLVMMHSLGVPPDKNRVLPPEIDPIVSVISWAEKRIQNLILHGIQRDRIIFDPGFGFGKTNSHSWELLRGMRRFQELGVRILVGHSRKSFLSSVTSHRPAERDVETLALTFDLLEQGVDFLRVHDCEKNARVLKVWSQVKGVARCQQ